MKKEFFLFIYYFFSYSTILYNENRVNRCDSFTRNNFVHQYFKMEHVHFLSGMFSIYMLLNINEFIYLYHKIRIICMYNVALLFQFCYHSGRLFWSSHELHPAFVQHFHSSGILQQSLCQLYQFSYALQQTLHKLYQSSWSLQQSFTQLQQSSLLLQQTFYKLQYSLRLLYNSTPLLYQSLLTLYHSNSIWENIPFIQDYKPLNKYTLNTCMNINADNGLMWDIYKKQNPNSYIF